MKRLSLFCAMLVVVPTSTTCFSTTFTLRSAIAVPKTVNSGLKMAQDWWVLTRGWSSEHQVALILSSVGLIACVVSVILLRRLGKGSLKAGIAALWKKIDQTVAVVVPQATVVLPGKPILQNWVRIEIRGDQQCEVTYVDYGVPGQSAGDSGTICTKSYAGRHLEVWYEKLTKKWCFVTSAQRSAVPSGHQLIDTQRGPGFLWISKNTGTFPGAYPGTASLPRINYIPTPLMQLPK